MGKRRVRLVEEVKEEKARSLSFCMKRAKGNGSRLYPRELMLMRRLWFEGWTDYQIWKEYHIPMPVIQKAKDEIERQATEEFENKKLQAVELARLKHLLKLVIDTNDAITKDPNVSLVHRLKSEGIKLEALAILRDTIEASIQALGQRLTLGQNHDMQFLDCCPILVLGHRINS